ncbi:transposase [Flavobacterium sp. ZS1P14]|uniref:transposase n=1 Tax=Flavobacterium sp. ZS1P14 TaxID=3401729 RepID=UPI003AAA6812
MMLLRSDKFNLLTNPRKKFISSVLFSFLSIKGRINFLQLERYGEYCEQSYRESFKEKFDFLEFNKALISKISPDVVIGFDPSYLSKSGKKTHGIGYFWSGVAGKSKWGLEMAGFAAIDPELNTAFHLNAIQTPCAEELSDLNMTLLAYYGSLITQNAQEFRKISKYIVADAYFSKLPFLEAVSKAKLFLVSRLRDDSNLKYLYNGPLTGKKGAPKKFEGKVNFKNINREHFYLDFQDEKMEVYGAILHSVAFKRKIKVALVRYLKDGKIISTKIYCSSNLKQETLEIVIFYRSRFQMEFVFRDGKQFAGVNTCEARSKEKIDFHINASLTSVNLAKMDWFSHEKNKKKPFSMADYKTHFNNELMIKTFMSKFEINPNKKKNKIIFRKLLDFGKIAA